MSSLAPFAARDVDSDVSLETLLLYLLITLLVTAIVYFVARELAPRHAGAAAVLVLIIGAILTLLATL